MALRMQQVLVDVPVSNLKSGESIRTFLHTLAARLGLASTELHQQFHELLSQVFASDLGFWICDYVAVVCADDAISSSDPEEHALLQPTGVLAWCHSSAQELQNRVVTLVKSGPITAAQPDHIIEVEHAAKTLLAVAEAVRAAMGSSPAVVNLISTLQLLQQTTQVLQWLEQLQQQRPGVPPLIARTVSSRTLSSTKPSTGTSAALKPVTAAPIEPFGPRTSPAHVSLPAWQQRLSQRRQSAPAGRLFLDDLVDQLLKLSAGQRAVDYPYSDVLSCVEALFMTGSSSSGAWTAKLALLLYYLLDGGWITSAATFAQGFQLSLTMVQQWQCHYLLDTAATDDSGSSTSAAAAAGAGNNSKLDQACQLLGATASPATPFRFVEALLAAGRPTTALAVQRARCAISSAGSAVGLSEARVLLKVQLGCGLLAEALSQLRRHCSQLSPTDRPIQVKALIQQLASWAAEPIKDQDHQQQQQQGSSRLQMLCQLPFNAEEEAALLSYFRQKMTEGEPVGRMVPLYLLQRGRSLEALKAYADYQASPAAAAATSAAGGAVLQRQLQTLMVAAAAALPPFLRATAVATSAGHSGTAVSVLAGLGCADADISKSAVPVAVLQSRGVEQPVFMTQLIPAAVAGAGDISETVPMDTAVAVGDAADTAAAAAAGGDADGSLAAAGAAPAAGNTFWRGFASTPATAAPAASGAGSSQFAGSLFRDEVTAAAGTGAVAIGPSNQGLAGASMAAATAADGDYVPLLFGTPAPTSAVGKAGFGVDYAGAEFNTPGGADVAGFSASGEQGAGFGMSEEEFSREVLGIQNSKAAEKSARVIGAAVTRSIKRQRQTPVGYRPGAK